MNDGDGSPRSTIGRPGERNHLTATGLPPSLVEFVVSPTPASTAFSRVTIDYRFQPFRPRLFLVAINFPVMPTPVSVPGRRVPDPRTCISAGCVRGIVWTIPFPAPALTKREAIAEAAMRVRPHQG
jgi:hypothetical protein